MMQFSYVFALVFSVVVPCHGQWATSNLARQRVLAADVPIDLTTDLRTHNSFNSEADGYQFPNQLLNLTDQLKLGARRIEFDVHHISVLEPPLRVCHGSSAARDGCLLADIEAEVIIGGPVDEFFVCETLFTPPIVDYGDSTGCYDNARTLLDALQEVEAWLRAESNSQEVLIIGFQTDSEIFADELNDVLSATIGDLVLTPPLKTSLFPSVWPSSNQLVQSGRRVILRSDQSFGGEYFLQTPSWPNYPANKVKYFLPYPQCDTSQSAPSPTSSFSSFYADESFIPNPALPSDPVYSGEDDTGIMTAEIAKQLNDCGYDSTFDFLTEEKAKLVVWSFEEPSPSVNTSLNCVAMGPSASHGWVDRNCLEFYFHACQSNANSSHWVLSSTPGNWFKGSENCPTEFNFAVPRVSNDNFQLKLVKQAHSQDFVWLQYSDIAEEGKWATGDVAKPTDSNPPAITSTPEDGSESDAFTTNDTPPSTSFDLDSSLQVDESRFLGIGFPAIMVIVAVAAGLFVLLCCGCILMSGRKKPREDVTFAG